MFIDLRVRGRKGERGGERDTDVRKKHQLVASWLGIKPTTQVFALTGDRTHNVLVYGTKIQPTEPPGQGRQGKLFNTNQNETKF